MLFKDIPGQEETKLALLSSVKENHVAHAQLFLGNEGGAGLTLALAYTQYLNCTDKQESDSCGKCPSCSKYQKLAHPDLHFLFPIAGKVDKDEERARIYADWRAFVQEIPFGSPNDWSTFLSAENKQLTISVDETRQMMGRLALKAYEGEYKTVIFWLPELLNVNAANAMLKMLEEPPAKTVFILVTNDSLKVLPTILSRTQIVKIPRYRDEQVAAYLEEKLNVSNKDALTIAALAEGNLFAAFKLVNDNATSQTTVFIEWLRYCWKNDVVKLSDLMEDFQKLGREAQKNFFGIGLRMMREALIWKLSSKPLNRVTEDELDFISKFAKIVTEVQIEAIVNELNKAYYHIERNANQKLVYFDTSLSLGRILQKA